MSVKKKYVQIRVNDEEKEGINKAVDRYYRLGRLYSKSISEYFINLHRKYGSK